jgi:N-terminal acetyltransferase B complex non-catalytic subunit
MKSGGRSGRLGGYGKKRASSGSRESSKRSEHGLRSSGDHALTGPHRDRNWLEFLSVLDATFSYLTPLNGEAPSQPSESKTAECSDHITKTLELFTRVAEEDGKQDRSAVLALLELEKRARSYGLSTGRQAMFTDLFHH